MPTRRSSRVSQKAEEAIAEGSSAATAVQSEVADAASPSTSTSKPKGKARAARHQPLLPEEAFRSPVSTEEDENPAEAATMQGAEATASSTKPTMEDRQARLAALRAKMAASTRANRKDILSEQSRTRSIASELKTPSASRKLHKAEKLLEERDLREAGEDVERHRNMNYSLEDTERWDAILEAKEKKKDNGPGDFGDAAERAYRRQVRMLKPDVEKYRRQRDEADAVKMASPASGALTTKGSGKQVQRSHDALEVDTIHYGTHRPTDDAIDRVVNHLNHERQVIQNRSRRRQEHPDAEVNYINDGNKHFNKKLKRYYDKQTQEIRENLERGTAL